MKSITKMIIGAAALISAAAAPKEAINTGSDVILHLPTGDQYITGTWINTEGYTYYSAYGDIEKTEKVAGAYIGNVAASISITDCKYTKRDDLPHWTVINFEICKGVDGDDAWINFEIGL